MRLDYTKDLLAKGKERKRLTEQLVELVDQVANQISDTVPAGREVAVNGAIYKISTYRSNLSTQDLLAVVTFAGEYHEEERIFGKGVGGSGYLHGDFGCPYHSADASQYLELANHLPEVIAAFQADEQKSVDALRQGFERLKAVAGK